MAAVTTARAATGDADALRPARPVDLRRAARLGLVAGVVGVFVSAIGMVEDFQPLLIVGGLGFGYVLLAAIAVGAGYVAATPPPVLQGYRVARPGARNVAAGLIAGALAGVVMAAFVLAVGAVNVRDVFLNVSPALVELLRFGRGPVAGASMLAGWATALGLVGGALHLAPRLVRRELGVAALWILIMSLFEQVIGQLLRDNGLGAVVNALYESSGGLSFLGAAIVGAVGVAIDLGVVRRRGTIRARVAADGTSGRSRWTWLLIALALLAVGAMPQILGTFLTSVANLAGIYMLMALGLNVVVGFAGLLDLGYVAFFAVGAYTTGVLTSPASPGFSPEMAFLVAIPFVLLAGVIAGLFVGTPVLKMRGDYLAIVTLGFGEIARLLAVSDWMKPTLGGAQGITRIPNVSIGGFELNTPTEFFYAIYGLAAVAIYVSYALQASRVGRAWVAMREDESVAEAMGVNIVGAKLLAFVMGAALASLGGALYASTIHSIFPATFGIEQSILILIIVIVGGLGSVPGVALGALILITLPELLREFEQYRFLIYGALLIFMMLRRPEGLIPSRRRAAELHEEDRSQDAWLRAQTEDPETPEAYSVPREI